MVNLNEVLDEIWFIEMFLKSWKTNNTLQPFYTLDDVAFLLRPVAGHRHPTKSSPDFIVHETTGHIDL